MGHLILYFLFAIVLSQISHSLQITVHETINLYEGDGAQSQQLHRVLGCCIYTGCCQYFIPYGNAVSFTKQIMQFLFFKSITRIKELPDLP